MPHMIYEYGIGGRVAGVDESGRGSLAGPVVAAAVVFNLIHVPDSLLRVVDDSKKLSSVQRRLLFATIKEYADIGIGTASTIEIDSLNVLRATLLAMRRAVKSLDDIKHALIDGSVVPQVNCSATAIIKGDQVSASVAAASIVAKVSRDYFMVHLAQNYPGYGWERNMGYGTKEHKTAIARLGPTLYHRKSFVPVTKLLCSSYI